MQMRWIQWQDAHPWVYAVPVVALVVLLWLQWREKNRFKGGR